jgi:Fic family protein
MTDSEAGVLSPDDVLRIDAQYRGLPAFAEWAGTAVADDLWQQAATILAERKASVPADVLDELVEQAMRAAAIDTGAIEGLYEVDRGFTISVSAMASAWQAEITQEKGPDVAALVLGQRHAYDLALDAATSGTPISEAWIRRLHEEVCAAQDTYPVRTPQGPQFHELPKGTYKRYPNHIRKADGTEHAFAPVADTPGEMHRLVETLRSTEFQAAHPVIQAAYAHYALAAIHPFADGNGRVARVLASVYLLRATSLPLVIWADQKADYFDALVSADEGRPQRFVDFVLSQTVDLQQELADLLSTAGLPPVDVSLERIRRAMVSQGELTHAEIELVAVRLMQELRDAVQTQLDGVRWPPGVARQMVAGSSTGEKVAGFRPPQNQGITGFRIIGAAPAEVTVEALLHVLIASQPDAPLAFRMRRIGLPDGLDLRLHDVHPTLSAAARRRILTWVERQVRSALADFAVQAESAVRPD